MANNSSRPHEIVACQAASGDAVRLLARWGDRLRRLHPDPLLFEKRLESLGLNRTTAVEWIAEKNFAEEDRTASQAVLLDEVLRPENLEHELISPDVLLAPPRRWDGTLVDRPITVPLFPEMALPFLNVALTRLRSVAVINRCLAPAAVDDIARFLFYGLSALAARTLAYEMKQRSRAGELVGESPTARYDDFMSRFVGSRIGLTDLIQKYPVLSRLLAARTEQTIAMVLELVERLDRDIDQIERLLDKARTLKVPWIEDANSSARFSAAAGNTGYVARLAMGLSDPHNDGRTVAILRLASGQRLVYKPRSLAIDAAYAQLVEWWNRTSPGPTLKCAKVLPRDGYGWAEFIDVRDCESRHEVAEYYRRQGAQTALFTVLQGNDFHSENFIAQGPFPVPIDLECLLTPIRALSPPAEADDPACCRYPAIVTTGMLPMWKCGDAGEECSVNCGIAGNAGRPASSVVPVWHGLGTDELAVRFEPRTHENEDDCLPRLDGQPIDANEFLGEIGDGFSLAFRKLLTHREELAAPDGELQVFRSIPVRCVMRTTPEYSFLLSWSTAPDHLTSNAAHDLAFEMLAKNGAALGDSLEWINHEKPQLWRRDVPTFYGNTTSRRVTDAEGTEIGPELPRTSYDQMIGTLEAMSEEDLAWQRELLVGSLRMALTPSVLKPDTRHTSPATQHLAEAIRLGEAIDHLALRCPLGTSWLTLEWEPHDPQQIMLGPVRSGLYSGGAGIALFLANLAIAANEPAFAALARDALRFSAAHEEWTLRKWPGYRDRLAAFGSPYSQAYSLAECGRVLGDDALLHRGIDFVLCQNDLPEITNPDFINGAAGAVCVLLHLHALAPDDRLLDRALHLAESIHALNGDGRGWHAFSGSLPLLGLAHGQIGIALAFDRLARVVDIPWARAAVVQAQDFESRHFDPSQGDWPNLQRDGAQRHFMVGWCGGAPGHGLARLGLLGGLADQDALQAEIDHAISTTRQALDPAPECLCCGVPGRLWFLSEAGHRLGRPDLVEAARAGAVRLIANRRNRGHWHTRPVSERDTLPTLMGGIAGIGLALLQVHRPGQVSQVLTLS